MAATDWSARYHVEALERRVAALEAAIEALKPENWEIPTECQVEGCGLVCNTDAEYDAHMRKEHKRNAT